MQQQRRRPPVPASPIAMNNNSSRPIRQSSRNTSMTLSPCSGCSQLMYNPLLSNVLDRLWHPDCVRCFACRCVLNEQCYSREGKLYCKDDFIKKYIHRCFSCQNIIQSHEFIRRVRAGRIYHAGCFICLKCKRILQDDDIASLIPSDGSPMNDLDYLCQTCSKSKNKLVKSSIGTAPSLNADEEETTDSENSNTTNGKALTNDRQVSPTMHIDALPAAHSIQSSIPNKPILSSIEQLSHQSKTTLAADNKAQSMQVDETSTSKASASPTKAHSSSSSSNSSTTHPSEIPDETETPPPPPPPSKHIGRPSKARQNSNNNNNNNN
ncbi:unnamed protein product, partial [Rotaria socialis]